MTPASRPNLEVAPPPVDRNNPYALALEETANPYSLSGPSRIKKRQRY